MKYRNALALALALIVGQAFALDASTGGKFSPSKVFVKHDQDAAVSIPITPAGQKRFAQMLDWCLAAPECNKQMGSAIEAGNPPWDGLAADLKAAVTQPVVYGDHILWAIGAGSIPQEVTLQHSYVEEFKLFDQPRFYPAAAFVRQLGQRLAEPGIKATILAKDQAEASLVASTLREYGAQISFAQAINPNAKEVTIKIYR